MKKFILVLIFSLLLVTLSGCNSFFGSLDASRSSSSEASGKEQDTKAPSNSEASEAQSNTTGISDSTTEVALVYMDPNTDAFLMIEQSDWYYQKDRASGITYFLNKKLDDLSSIALSSRLLWDSPDPIGDIWKVILESQPPDIKIVGEAEVKVGEAEYTGKCYDFTATFYGEQVNLRYYIWYTKDKLYICSLVCTDVHKDFVFAAGESIVKTFKTYSEL